jgi:hypothetical protein
MLLDNFPGCGKILPAGLILTKHLPVAKKLRRPLRCLVACGGLSNRGTETGLRALSVLIESEPESTL